MARIAAMIAGGMGVGGGPGGAAGGAQAWLASSHSAGKRELGAAWAKSDADAKKEAKREPPSGPGSKTPIAAPPTPAQMATPAGVMAPPLAQPNPYELHPATEQVARLGGPQANPADVNMLSLLYQNV